MASDAELLLRYSRHQDEVAFADLVTRHLAVVFNAALRRAHGDHHLAEEATQIVFTLLARNAAQLSAHRAILGWMHTATRYATNTLVRRERRLAQRRQTAATMHVDEPSPPDWENIQPLVDAALDRLPALHRQAILLRFFSERSFAEIGAELDLSENAARKCVDRALEKMRHEFRRGGMSTTAAALSVALASAPVHAASPPLGPAIIAGALANAGAPGTIAGLGLFSFMSTAKIVGTAIVTLVAITSVGSAWLFANQQQRQAQIDALRVETQQIEARLREPKSKPDAPAQINASTATVAPQTRPNAVSDLARRNLNTALLKATSPRYAAVRAQENRLKFLHEYGAFVAVRNYSAEKTNALRQAMSDYYDRARVHRLEQLADSSESRQTSRGALADDKKALLEAVAQSFTDDEQKDIRRAFESQDSMPAAEEAGRALAFDGVPMDRFQHLALAMVLADEKRIAAAAPPEQRRILNQLNAATGLTAVESKCLDDTGAFLSPPQVKSYEQYLKSNHLTEVAADRAREMLKTKGGKP